MILASIDNGQQILFQMKRNAENSVFINYPSFVRFSIDSIQE